MPNRLTIPLIGLSLFLSAHETARAESTHDRVALMLSGPDCPSVQKMMASTLRQQTGVLHVDTDLMPDHVLVDIARQELTEETVAVTANKAMSGSQCRAEIMKSCITADMAAHPPSETP
jgi:hypothetical protein